MKSNPSFKTTEAPEWSRRADPSFLFDQKRVWIMGVLNVTPDSFYERSRFPSVEKACAQAELLITQNADVLDIGGESTRPGSEAVSTPEELDRVIPLIDALRYQHPHTFLSVDTQKALVAQQALERGVALVNDISALRHDPEMASVVASARVPVVLMHMQGVPATMQHDPTYTDVIAEIQRFFEERIHYATQQGIAEDRIILDPGIGFGKTLHHNVQILNHLSDFQSLGRPLLVGLSRKAFLGRLDVSQRSSGTPADDRLPATLAANLWAVQQGAAGLRVHDVGATKQALETWNHLAINPR